MLFRSRRVPRASLEKADDLGAAVAGARATSRRRRGVRRRQRASGSFGLSGSGHYEVDAVREDSYAEKVAGEARSAADYADIKKALSGPLPTGLTIMAENVRPPMADPFVFVADLDANELSLSGSVPSEGARQNVRELSRQLFAR